MGEKDDPIQFQPLVVQTDEKPKLADFDDCKLCHVHKHKGLAFCEIKGANKILHQHFHNSENSELIVLYMERKVEG